MSKRITITQRALTLAGIAFAFQANAGFAGGPVVQVYPFESSSDSQAISVGPASLYADHFDSDFSNPEWAGKDRLCVFYGGVLTESGIPAGSGITVAFANTGVSGELINGERAGVSSSVSGCLDISSIPSGTVSMYFQSGSNYDSDYGRNYQFVLQR